jgi:hypothetical protein
MFLIWSLEHDGWWAPNEIGYTRELGEAGRYGKQHAGLILERANAMHNGVLRDYLAAHPRTDGERIALHECLVPLACVEPYVAVSPSERKQYHDLLVACAMALGSQHPLSARIDDLLRPSAIAGRYLPPEGC